MDAITLDGIEVWARHGVLQHEEELGQRFVVDLTIHLDLMAAARSDDLDATVDYGTLAEVVADAATAPRARLVETVAGRVADAALAHDDRIVSVDVVLHKPSAPLTVPVRDVRVQLSRAR